MPRLYEKCIDYNNRYDKVTLFLVHFSDSLFIYCILTKNQTQNERRKYFQAASCLKRRSQKPAKFKASTIVYEFEE